MALSQFGGRGGSTGSGTTGPTVATATIGEMVLVPSTFASPDFAEAGQLVTAAAYPELYKTLSTKSGTVTSFTTHTQQAVASTVITAIRPIASFIREGFVYLVLHTGKIVKSVDGQTFADAGSLPLNTPIERSAIGADNLDRQLLNVVAGTFGQTSVVITLSYGKAYSWSTTNGVDWKRFEDVNLNTIASKVSFNRTTLNAFTAYGRNWSNNGSTGLLVCSGRVLTSTNGTTWKDITSNLPAVTYTASMPVYADDSIMTFLASPSAYTSIDGGTTWKTATVTYLNGSAPTAFTNIQKFRGNLYFGAYNASSQVGFYTTVDGTSWTQAGASSVTGTTTSTYQIGMFTDGTTLRVYSFNSNRAYSTTDGTSWALSTNVTALTGVPQFFFPLPNGRAMGIGAAGYASDYGRVVLGTATIDAAVGPTYTLGAPFSINGNPGIMEMSTNGNVFVGIQASTITTNEIFVGDATAVRVVTLPVADSWVGVTWSAKANKFFLVGKTNPSVFYSTDGLTWSKTTVGVDQPVTLANTLPFAGGDFVAFVPRTTTTSNIVMAVIEEDGTFYYGSGISGCTGSITTRHSAAGASDGTNAVWTWTSNYQGSFPGRSEIFNDTTTGAVINVGTNPNTSSIFSAFCGSRYVSMSTSIVNSVTTTTVYTTLLQVTPSKVTLPSAVTATLPVGVAGGTILGVGDDIYVICAGTTYVSADGGATWVGIATNGIPSSSVWNCKIVKGVPIVSTSAGLYVGTAIGTARFIPNYTSSTLGMKYVVRAK